MIVFDPYSSILHAGTLGAKQSATVTIYPFLTLGSFVDWEVEDHSVNPKTLDGGPGQFFPSLPQSLRLPPYLLVFLCCTAYRVHSIFVLRMFNDPLAMLVLYVAVSLFMSDLWTLGCAFFRWVCKLLRYMYMCSWIVLRWWKFRCSTV